MSIKSGVESLMFTRRFFKNVSRAAERYFSRSDLEVTVDFISPFSQALCISLSQSSSLIFFRLVTEEARENRGTPGTGRILPAGMAQPDRQ
jgi:hypothetical protein